MTKVELIAQVAEKTGTSKKASEEAVAAVLASITEALQNGEKVSLVGFGTFEVKERAERTCLNPQTKETINVPASKAPSFKAGKALKDAVAKSPVRWPSTPSSYFWTSLSQVWTRLRSRTSSTSSRSSNTAT